MNNSRKILVPLVAALFLIFGMMLGLFLNKGKSPLIGGENDKYGKKLADIFDIIDKNYVDSINKDDLFEKTVSELLHNLDPHSNYIAARDLKEMTESIQGQFGGVGIRFTVFDDTLNVVNVIENSPSEREGIQKFDQIIEVNGENIAGVKISNDRVRELLKGTVGSKVTVQIKRKNQTFEKTIIRGNVPITSLNAAYMMTEDIAYMQLTQFSLISANEFYLAASNLKSQGMKSLILDLRYNGGGVMSSAVSILEAFLPKGAKIVSTKGKNTPEEIIYAQSQPFLKDINLVVLINTNSASASEIVAGAIQDNDRGTIIGRRSFGKGLVQQDIQLKDGSDLRLTISRYYTPTGRSIQKPYSNGTYEEYLMDEVNRYESGELYKLDSSLFVDSLKYTTPKGKVVYGGGGIMPDIFVPLDTLDYSSYYRRLKYANAFNEFSYAYARKNNLNQYTNLVDFDKRFVVSQKILDDFVAFASKKFSISLFRNDYQHSLQRIKTDLKAEIARQRWLENGAFYIFNQRDKDVEKAVEVLKKEK